MVISIDHGNRQVKTVHKAFVSGLMESSVRPALGEEYILYNNRYFSLTEHRLAYRRDKSKDESFFLLSLFGIHRNISPYIQNSILRCSGDGRENAVQVV